MKSFFFFKKPRYLKKEPKRIIQNEMMVTEMKSSTGNVKDEIVMLKTLNLNVIKPLIFAIS